MFRKSIAAAVAALGLAGCVTSPDPLRTPDADFAIEHVTVLPMTEGVTSIPDATVVVRNGRIVEIAREGAKVSTRVTRRIDGRGKYLLPGFADMHVHVLNRGYGRERIGSAYPSAYMRTGDLMLPFIANGVTQILEMSAIPETLEQRAEIESGAELGPHIATAAMIDGDPPVWTLNARVATTPEAGRQAVREIAAAGYDFVKVYARLKLPVFEAVVDEARSAGVGVVGHMPEGSRGHADQVLIPGMGMVAHAEEFSKLAREPTAEDVARYAGLVRQGRIRVATTLTTNVWVARQTRDPDAINRARGIEYLHPVLRDNWAHANRYTSDFSEDVASRRDALVPFTRTLVRRMAEAGVPLLPGTDSIVPGLVYGFSLHDELELMSEAGMDNHRVLESATRLPAEFLGVAADRGAVEVGKAADLVMLDADPFQDISNTRLIAAVIVGGRYLSKAELDARLSDLAARYRDLPVRPAAVGGE